MPENAKRTRTSPGPGSGVGISPTCSTSAAGPGLSYHLRAPPNPSPRQRLSPRARGAAPDLLFFAGCSEEQVTLPFDYRVVLTAPAEILVQRLATRTKGYGRSAEQRAQILADLADVEPLLRRSADLILVTTEPTPLIADALLGGIAERQLAR